MNQKPNRRTILWFLLLMTLIIAIIYAKPITLADIYNRYIEVRDFVISSKDFQFWGTIFTLSGFGVVGFFVLLSQFLKPKSPPVDKEVKSDKTKSESSVKLDWGNFAVSQQPIMSVTASHISIEDKNTIKVASVPIPRRWERPTDRDPLNRQGQAVGRRQELSELWARLKQNTQPMVTIVGMPGLGKSTVASMFIQEYGDKYAGGQLWTEIGFEFRSQEQCQAILNYWASWAYGGDLHRLQQDEQWQKLQFEPAAVKELLSKQGPLLVVLDDVWDLDAVQPLREALPPETALLVTTRDARIAKRLTGEMPLTVLSPEDALALLQKFLPRMAVEQLKPLVHGLGYHAQALTIAGGDIQARGEHRQQKAIQDLLRRVEKGQGFGDLPQLDEHDRQNEVEIAFRFSYDDIKKKMEVDYQQRLRLLGAFGPLEADFSTEAAATLWQDDLKQASDFLDVLQARSLLIKRKEEERWGQHPLLRAYSRALLRRAQEWEMAKQRYINYVIDFADKGFKRPMQEWASLKPDFPHLYYVGDALFQQLSEKLGDLKTLAQPKATTLPSIDELDELTKQQLTMASQFSYNTGEYIGNRPEIGERGFNWVWMGLASARVLEQKDKESTLLNQIGFIYDATSQYEQALKYYNESLIIGQEMGNRNGEATVLQNIGVVYQTLSQYDKALGFFNQALPILQEVGNRNMEAIALQNIGMVHQALSQPDKALEFFNQALPILQEVGNRYGEAGVLQNIGLTYQSLSQNDRSLEFYNQALPILQEVGNRYGEGIVLKNLAWLYHEAFGQYEDALKYFNQAIEPLQISGNLVAIASNYQARGQTNERLGNNTDALDDFSRAIESQPNNGFHYHWRGTIYFDVQDYTKALADLTRAIELQPESSENFYWRGRTYYELGNEAASVNDFMQPIPLQTEDGYKFQYKYTDLAIPNHTLALADFNRAVELQPDNAEYVKWQGLVRKQQ